MDTMLAPKKLNKGGILKNFNKVIPALVHAADSSEMFCGLISRIFLEIFFSPQKIIISQTTIFFMKI